jgi:hypothetical protein
VTSDPRGPAIHEIAPILPLSSIAAMLGEAQTDTIMGRKPSGQYPSAAEHGWSPRISLFGLRRPSRCHQYLSIFQRKP